MRASRTIFGALNMETSRFYWKQASEGKGKQFIKFLYQLHQSKPKKKLFLILDNSSIHRSKKVQKFIKDHAWVELFFLPTYSPEYNPVERFWNWLKQQVYGVKTFIKIEDLVRKIRKIIWHYHAGDLVSKISFNYEAYKKIALDI